MQRLELSGWLGLFIIIASSLLVLFLVLLLPTMVATALWNAVVYETLGGPVVGLQQGFLIWSLVCVVLYGIFRPSIQVVLDEADLANMDEVDFKFGSKKRPSKTEKKIKKNASTPKKEAEHEVFALRSGNATKEKGVAPSAHWLKWRKQQAEALQVAAEAKLKAKKQAEATAEEEAITKP